MNQNYLLLLLLITMQFITAQKNGCKIPDSLQNKDFNYLDQRIYDLRKDNSKTAVYIDTYIAKAKKEQNWKELVNGYQNAMHQSNDRLRLIYSDSLVFAAKKANDNALIGSSYLTKGAVFYSQKQQKQALDNYIIANNYISRTNDDYLKYKVKYCIAQVKYYLGFYDEAISLLKECLIYFKADDSRPYLNSLHSLGLCYNKIGNYGLCTETNSIGVSESNRLDTKEMLPYFRHSEGINEYFKQNYQLAIKSIESSLGEIAENKDFANESVGNFYIGKSYWDLKKPELALPYFKKVDQAFKDKQYMRPDLREVYEILIQYFKKTNDLKSQLYYIDQLLKADKVLNETFKYLVSKINKEYDTKELLTEREKIKEQLIRRKYNDAILVAIIILLFIILTFFSYRHFKNRSLYKQKFNELMLKMKDEKKAKPKLEKPEILDINADAVATVLRQLEKFERDKKFLEKDWTLVKLSAAFDSNTKYISKIISHYRDKGYTEYINELRIEYLISLLNDDKRIRNYTNKALAEEAGFSSTQRFANAFLAKTGMPTNFFIEALKEGQQ
ncbi:AraC family transcriptional regulator [Flavobacterium granuli]|uniref:AraC-like DNA-binding protein n=1 Tax=Flavobacterium granuli TaxID=280093 RepID=A0ABU1S3G6_9FLAO|nr:AraC family transcriptional regulator [Flavobacterium granuli]MDR6845581.1 AraC-like DNA-binding protein [Flavobacterium granuli]